MGLSLNVLFVTPYFKPFMGGVERVVDELSKNLLNYKHISKVSILTTFSSYPSGTHHTSPHYEIDEGREIYRLDFVPKDIPPIYHAYNAGYFSSELKVLLKNLSPDIVHFCKIEWFIPNMLVYFLTKGTSSHFLFSSYHPKPLSVNHWPMLIANKYLLKRMNKIHTPSDFIAMATAKAFNIPKQNILTISNGVNSITGESRRGKGKPHLLLVGRFSRIKGQYEFLKKQIELYQGLTDKARITMVGNDDGELGLIRDLIQDKQLSNIRIVEHPDDRILQKLYLEADIFISTSFMEGFGIAVLEAMSAGLPVVAFSSGAISEVINKKALLVDPGDWVGLMREIKRMIEDPKLCEYLGQESRNFVLKNYTWTSMAESVKSMYFDS